MKIVEDNEGRRWLYFRSKDSEPVAYAEQGDACWTATVYGLSPEGARVNFDGVGATKEAAQEAIRSGVVRMTPSALGAEAMRRVARTARPVCSRCRKRAREREPAQWRYWMLGREREDGIDFWEADACPDCTDAVDAIAARLLAEGWVDCKDFAGRRDKRIT